MAAIKKFKEIAKAWNKLKTDKARWKYLMSHKSEISLQLDNNKTYACFSEHLFPDGFDVDDYDDFPELNSFEWWVGDSPGLPDLFEILGINAEGV